MALYGSVESVRLQVRNTAGFAKAFAYVEELLRAGSPVQQRVRALARGSKGKVDLGDGAFVIEEAYETKARADGFFESHRNVIDVQTILEGEELMEVADIAKMKVRHPYNPERDLIVYEDYPDAALLRLQAGQVAVFYPTDVHMPTLRIRETAVPVRKCVVKIPVGL